MWLGAIWGIVEPGPLPSFLISQCFLGPTERTNNASESVEMDWWVQRWRSATLIQNVSTVTYISTMDIDTEDNICCLFRKLQKSRHMNLMHSPFEKTEALYPKSLIDSSLLLCFTNSEVLTSIISFRSPMLVDLYHLCQSILAEREDRQNSQIFSSAALPSCGGMETCREDSAQQFETPVLWNCCLFVNK